MRKILLDASTWTDIGHFYDALLPALGAPEGHGAGIDAIIDSMIWGGMNDVEPPYTVIIYNTKDIDHKVLDHLRLAEYHLTEARVYFKSSEGEDVEVALEITD